MWYTRLPSVSTLPNSNFVTILLVNVIDKPINNKYYLASQCAALPDVPHANVTILNGLGRSYGTIIRYECEPGYIRSGPPVILCMSNGTWSGEVPVCSSKFSKCEN